MGFAARLRSWGWVRSVGAGSLGLLVAASAGATPVTVWFDGVSGAGIDAASATAVAAAGVPSFSTTPFIFADPSNTHFATATLNNPITPSSLPTSPSKTNPVEATAQFQFTALDRDYQDLWIVLLGHEPNDPTGSFYDTSNVGLEIDSADPWRSIPISGGFTYLAFFVGDVAQNDSVTVDFEYRVAQSLFLLNPGPPKRFQFPQLWVAYTEVAVPEPTGIVLLAAGLAGLALRKRRS
jgi:hypothetical protein